MRFVQAGVMALGAVLYVACFFVFSVSAYDTSHSPDNGADWSANFVYAALLGWNILVLVAMILAIIDSVKKTRAGKTRELATGVFVVKLASIPLFLLNFALLALIALLGAALVFVRGIGLAALPLLAVGIGLNYLTMLSTSIYGWASIVQLRRERRIGKLLAVLYAILLFIFVADTVVGIMLFVHYRRGKKAAAAPQSANIEAGVAHS